MKRHVKEDAPASSVVVANSKEQPIELLYNFITTKINIANLLNNVLDIVVDKEEKVFYVYFITERLDNSLVDKFISEVQSKLPYDVKLDSGDKLIIALADKPMSAVYDDEVIALEFPDVKPSEDDPTGVVDLTIERKADEMKQIVQTCPKCNESIAPEENLTEALRVRCPKCGEEFDIKLVTSVPKKEEPKPEEPEKAPAEPKPEPEKPPEDKGKEVSASPAPTAPSSPEMSGDEGEKKESVRECLDCGVKFIIDAKKCPKCSSAYLGVFSEGKDAVENFIEETITRCDKGEISLDEMMTLLGTK